MKPFRKILVPVDFSEHSEQAVCVAADLARRNGGTLDIVHVYDPVAYPLPEGYVLFTSQQLTRMFAEFDQRLRALAQLAQELGAPSPTTHLRQGITASDICAFAGEGGFDLIVMGTHGRGGVSHLLLGSVAERVLRSAPCPVLTVKAPAAAERRAAVGDDAASSACCS
jgi:universal stress protein A